MITLALDVGVASNPHTLASNTVSEFAAKQDKLVVSPAISAAQLIIAGDANAAVEAANLTLLATQQGPAGTPPGSRSGFPWLGAGAAGPCPSRQYSF